MNITNMINRSGTTATRVLLSLPLLLISGLIANASMLTDGNSSVTINPMSSKGASEWIVDGQDQLYLQWFWYRDAASAYEASLDDLGPLVETVHSASSTTLGYSGANFSVEVTYTLNGGLPNSGTSQLEELISIHNTSSTALSLEFFQYSDFDLGGDAGGDTVTVFPNFSPFALAEQVDGVLSFTEVVDATVVNNPFADRAEVAGAPSIYNKLEDLNLDNLNNSTGPYTGDASFAFQWSLQLAPDDVAQISKIKTVDITPIPEPTTAVLGLMSLTLLAVRFGSRRS